MLSRPSALPDINCLMVTSSSYTVKSDDRLASAVAALESEVTSCGVQRAKSLGSVRYSEVAKAMALAVTGRTPRVRRASACQLVCGLPHLAT